MTKGKFRPWLFLVLVWLHVMAAYAVWYGFHHNEFVWRGIHHRGFSLGAWGWFLLFYTLRQVGISLGNHRMFTHGAFKCHFATKVVLAFCSGLAAQGFIAKWCADHWQHHSDTEGPWDPHSPSKYPGWKGFWWAHIGWLCFEVVRPPSPDFDTMFAHRNPRLNKWDRWVYPIAVLSGFVLPYYFSGTGAMLFAGFLGVVFHLHITWFTNSLDHIYGYTDERFRKTDDTSKNNWLHALISWIGEAFHFNHHAKPDSAILGWKWYHPDLGKWILRAGEPLGIFWDIKRPPTGA